MSVDFQETQYGFKWGSLEIQRVASFNQDHSIVIWLKTPRGRVELRATATGFLRIWKGGKWENVELEDVGDQ